MPRQTYLTKDFFVTASESATKQIILAIPTFIRNIKLVGENNVIRSVKFLYERPGADLHHHVDVSVLPLNEQFTRVTLHASYANGQAFYNDDFVENTLHNFESAIMAGVNGQLSIYELKEPRISTPKKIATYLAASLGVFFLVWKKFS
jgi:hypothetical protein